MSQKMKPASRSLREVHKQWALWSARRMRFLNPNLTLTLYETDLSFTLYVADCDDSSFSALAEFFDNKVRPITCNIHLS